MNGQVKDAKGPDPHKTKHWRIGASEVFDHRRLLLFPRSASYQLFYQPISHHGPGLFVSVEVRAGYTPA